jgi:NSS family neurotransmitter:Na+ symporter
MAKLKLSTQSWSSQTAFILAAVGSAVGLGNIWKFPYIAGENGGGAFVLVYLACVLAIGIPVLISEIALGRMGKANPVQAMANLAQESGASKYWALVGINGVLAGILILSFYTVIAGWAVAYFFESVMGQFNGITAPEVQTHFKSLLASPGQLIFWHTLVVLYTVIIVAKGVKSGLEKAINFMMPGLFLILLVLVGYAATTGAFMQSVHFLFDPDFSKLTWQAVLIAMGHAFFTLSIGMGTMMVYGSYMKREYSIVKAGIWIAMMDTLVALLAGLVIFSIVFANDLEPGAGPGLLFQTIPVAFGQMSGGWFFGSLFFLLVVMAALSSAISLIEPAVSWLEQNWGIRRRTAAWTLGAVCWLLGLGTVFSFNSAADWHILGERNFFDSLDFLTANIMLPLGGLMMAVFMGWTLTDEKRNEHLHLSKGWLQLFTFDLRYIASVAVIIVFVSNLVEGGHVWLLGGLTFLLYVAYAWRVQKLRACAVKS